MLFLFFLKSVQMPFLGKEKGPSLLQIHSRMGPNSVMNVIDPDNQVTLSSPYCMFQWPRRASELYTACGGSQPTSNALAKDARVLEDAKPF